MRVKPHLLFCRISKCCAKQSKLNFKRNFSSSKTFRTYAEMNAVQNKSLTTSNMSKKMPQLANTRWLRASSSFRIELLARLMLSSISNDTRIIRRGQERGRQACGNIAIGGRKARKIWWVPKAQRVKATRTTSAMRAITLWNG